MFAGSKDGIYINFMMKHFLNQDTPGRLRVGVVNLSLVCLLLMSGLLAPTTQAHDSEIIPGEIVVRLRDGANLAAIAAAHQLDPQPLGQFGQRPIFRLRLLDNADPSQRAVEVQRNNEVLYAEPNYRSEAPEGRSRVSWARGDQADYVAPWFVDVLGLTAAQQRSRGAGVTVAVLDTGVDMTHPALVGHLVPGYDFVDNDADPSEQGTAGPTSMYGHGTHVAGLIALVAPDAKIMPLRVLDVNGAGNVWVLAEALGFALDPDNNPATNDGVQVINLSLSTLRRTALLRDLLGACEDDVCPINLPMVVAAAGNNGNDEPEYPAGENQHGLLAVGASTAADTVAAFSNRGSWVQLTAPGDQITSSVPGGWGTWSGTSMAAPLVAGTAALVRSAAPTFNAQQTADHIEAHSRRSDSEVQQRLDIAAALNALPAAPPTNYHVWLPFVAR